MSRDINRFNGKYLKCVITPNITSTDVLKNSGSIIIYHPSLPFSTGESNTKSYLYNYTNNENDNSIMGLLATSINDFVINNETNIIEDNIGNFEAYNFEENNNYYTILKSQFDTSTNDKDILSTFTIYPWSTNNKNINDQIYSYANLQGVEYKNDKNNINYLFLGNEFIASGYGFRTIEERDNISWLSSNFKSVFKSLYDLNQNNFKLIENTYNTIVPLLNKYVKINGGDVSGTIVQLANIDNVDNEDKEKTVNLIDLLMPGIEEEYKDLVINSIDIKINGITVTDNILDLPIGKNIANIDIEIKGDLNDAGPIEYIELQYNYMTEGYTNAISTQTLKTEIYQDQNTNTNKFEYIVNINYTKVNNISQTYYILDGLQNIINYIKIHVGQTPNSKKKYYNDLYNKDGVKIFSTGNMIPEHDIILDPIKINGIYPVFYKINNYPIQDNYSAKEINDYITNNSDEAGIIKIVKNELNSTIIKDGIININILKNTKYLFLAIPVKFKVYKVEYEDGVNHFIHNWTGCLKVYNTDTNEQNENMFLLDENIRYMQCNVYVLVMSKGIKINGNIRIYVNDITNEAQDIKFADTIVDTNGNTGLNNTLNEITFNKNNISYIQNCEFNSTYWLTASYDENDEDFYIGTYLNNFYDNGAN